MKAILLHYLLPLALPTIAYILWIWYCAKRVEEGQEPPAITRGGLFWSMMSGIVLMIIGLIAVALSTGDEPGKTYQSPRFEDGRIVAPEFKDQ